MNYQLGQIGGICGNTAASSNMDAVFDSLNSSMAALKEVVQRVNGASDRLYGAQLKDVACGGTAPNIGEASCLAAKIQELASIVDALNEASSRLV